VVLGGSGDIGFIFPQLHPGFDAMFRLLPIEMLTMQERSLDSVRTELPRVYHKTHSSLPLDSEGALMRHFVETHPAQDLS